MLSFRSVRLAGVLLLAALLGCTTTPLPYQARSADPLSYGYVDTQMDALHYSIAYSDSHAAQAQNFLQLRAAQIAQGAGFPYFAFDTQGTSSFRKTENEIQVGPTNSGGVNSRGGSPQDINATIPKSYIKNVSVYYYAWGNISLLTADQAQGNSKAVQVSQVLAQLGSNIRP